MPQFFTRTALLSGVLISSASAFGVDLSGSSYDLDVPAQSGNITVISFDYDHGGTPYSTGAAAINFQPGGSPGGWLMPIFFTGTDMVIDSDYGPYVMAGNPSGSNNYKFTLNEFTGEGTLHFNGALVTFAATSSYPGYVDTSPQPDGSTSPFTTFFFSDESPVSYTNATALGWDSSAPDGVGGSGTYLITFAQGAGASVDNVSFVPEPASAAVLGLIGAAGLMRRRRRFI